MRKLDWYILRKFLGSFVLTMVLILSIAIVFDISEKLDDFQNGAELHEIIFDYYINFIASMFTVPNFVSDVSNQSDSLIFQISF